MMERHALGIPGGQILALHLQRCRSWRRLLALLKRPSAYRYCRMNYKRAARNCCRQAQGNFPGLAIRGMG